MKLVSLILSIHVLFLTISPAMASSCFFLNNNCTKSCCSINKENNTHLQKNCCKNGICNPFMICCNYSALIVYIKKVMLYSTYLKKQYNLKREMITFAYTADTWHPPEIRYINL
jgi:hypothetical protein